VVVVRPRKEAAITAAVRPFERDLPRGRPFDAAGKHPDELDSPEGVDIVPDGDSEAAAIAVVVDPGQGLQRIDAGKAA
jgi:hypothetical protein